MSRALFNLYKMPGFRSLSVLQQLQLFNSLIKPILMYGSEVWGLEPILQRLKKHKQVTMGSFYNIWSAQKIVNRFYRGVLGLHSKTPMLPILGDLGSYPIYIDIATSSLKYWAKTMGKGNRESLIYKAMLESYSMYSKNSNTCNFTSGLYNLLSHLGLSGIWDNVGGKNVHASLGVIKKGLKIDFLKFWNAEIFNPEHSRYLYYSKVKSSFQMENYINLINDPTLRTHMAKLRTSTHSLLIEKGRHLGLPRDKRLCQMCDVIEDEEHFLFDCAKHSTLRSIIFNNLNMDLLYEVYNQGTKDEILKLAKFVKNCSSVSSSLSATLQV